MKLVTQYFHYHEAEETSDRLRRAGVMTVALGKGFRTLGVKMTGMYQASLWVVFDDQFDDANKLLENPDHIPSRKMTTEEMNELEESIKKEQFLKGQLFIRKSATVVLALLLVCVLAYVIWGVINDA
jgi:hypothetical protein